MTTKQLYEDVLRMGFDRLPSDGETDAHALFETAVNRAQETLAAVFPLTETVTLSGLMPAAAVSLPSVTVHAGEVREYTGDGILAYSFRAIGNGTVSVFRDDLLFARYELSDAHFTKDVDGEFPAAVDCRIRIEANGNTDCTLYDLMLLYRADRGATYRANETDYRLEALVEGGTMLEGAPHKLDGTPLTEGRDYRLFGNTFTLLRRSGMSGNGCVRLTVRRLPRHFDLSCEVPDVRAEAAHLLPLLTAAYVWLDADREKSLFYLSMYRDALARQTTNGRLAASHGYDKGNGW